MFVGCWDEKRNSMKLKIKENTELIQKSWLKDPVLEFSFFFTWSQISWGPIL